MWFNWISQYNEYRNFNLSSTLCKLSNLLKEIVCGETTVPSLALMGLWLCTQESWIQQVTRSWPCLLNVSWECLIIQCLICNCTYPQTTCSGVSRHQLPPKVYQLKCKQVVVGPWSFWIWCGWPSQSLYPAFSQWWLYSTAVVAFWEVVQVAPKDLDSQIAKSSKEKKCQHWQ